MITLENLAEYGRDVFFYYGSINRSGYNQISDCLEKIENKSSAVCLVLSTTGGDADAAYRIARALQYYYKEFDILIPGLCKSAGTLLAIGANRLVFGDRGELGPLDIQLSKPDEMFENMSGLDIIQAISAIESGTLRAFKRYLFDIRGGSGIRTKMAAEIAVQLAEKCFAPMVAKIDPVTLGEHQRAMQIAIDYGERLNEQSCNLKEGALERLVSAYPCHGFVIDRRESRTLFKEIVVPEGPIANVYHWARNVI
ncbi:MAG: SppA protein, partial [Desulfobulbaceae bacterium]|nr:SppA protein [Desulfobulbaceae bacterium]